ncbi:unnamed protein product [Trichobilharzia regenti]|nr:unnamed protein product [Trichobilharzia regenti]
MHHRTKHGMTVNCASTSPSSTFKCPSKDSVDREVIWKLLQHYGKQSSYSLSTTFNSWLYDNDTCQVIHNGKLREALELNTGVRQGLLPTITHDAFPNCGERTGLTIIINNNNFALFQKQYLWYSVEFSAHIYNIASDFIVHLKGVL